MTPDVDTDVVTGSALTHLGEPGEGVWIVAYDHMNSAYRSVQPATEQKNKNKDPAIGSWTADFGAPGDNIGSSENTIDLLPTTGIEANTGDEDGDSTRAVSPPAPSIMANPDNDAIGGSHWATNTNAPVSVSVQGQDDAQIQPNELVQPNELDDGGGFWLDLGYDLTSGMTITASQAGMPTKELTPTDLTITDVDVAANTVSGTTESGVTVALVADDNPDSYTETTAEAGGTWFADVPHDITPSSNVTAFEWDADGDITEASWPAPTPPNPTINADPETDTVWGFDWTPDTLLTVTVGGTAQGPVTVASDGCFQLDLLGSVDFTTTTTIAASQAGMPTKELTPTDLTITAVDPEAGTVTGSTSSPTGTPIQVTGEDATSSGYTETTVMADGTWTADLGAAGYTIVAASGITAFEWDADGDATQVGWHAPNASIVVDPDYNAVWGSGEWPASTEVTVTVVDQNYEAQATTDDTGWFLVEIYPTQADLTPGTVVSVTDGAITKTTTVTPLAVGEVDADSNKVTGVATAGTTVTVGLWDETTGESLLAVDVPADASTGAWTASFAGTGYAIGTDTNTGYATEPEVEYDGDATQVDWHVPEA
jgi:hypothetical protein